MCNGRVISDKPTIEVAETQEGLGLLDCGGDRPLGDASDFGRVHANLAIGNNDTQVFNGGFIKGTLLRFEIEIKLAKTLCVRSWRVRRES